MVKGFTSLIGLAVVVALALAAVFGSMSLANPAMAAIGQPADAELTERTFAPQAMVPLTLHVGEMEAVNLIPYMGGRQSDFDEVSSVVPLNPAIATAAATNVFNVLGVTVTAVAEGETELLVTLSFDEGADIDVQINVEVLGPTAPTVKERIGTIQVVEAVEAIAADPTATPPITAVDAGPGPTKEIELSDYFEDGRGTAGAIASYSVSIFETDGTTDASSQVSAAIETTTPTDDVESNLQLIAQIGTQDGRYIVVVEAVDGNTDADAPAHPTQRFFVVIVDREAVAAAAAVGISFTIDNEDAGTADAIPEADPGDVVRYTVTFTTAEGSTVDTLLDDLVIEFHEDFSLPSSIDESAIAVKVGSDTVTPEAVVVDGEKVFLSLGDLDPNADIDKHTVEGDTPVEVLFKASAGIATPTEAGGYYLVAIDFGDGISVEYDEDDESKEPIDSVKLDVIRKISLSEEDGGLGDVVEATGSGFKNGTTLTVFLDKPVDHDDDPNTPYMPDGELNLGEDVLCVVARISGDDTGTCEFSITHPTFVAGTNYVNAVDGRNGYAASPDEFLLEQSIQASPDSGSPGEIILIQMVDFPRGTSVDRVRLGRQEYCGSRATPTGDMVTCPAAVVDSTGSANFSITIPNWARAGVQDLRVDAGGVGAGTNVTIGGPVITTTPSDVLANQRISLIGTGFSPNSVIGDDDELGNDMPDSQNDVSKISIGGEVISRGRINGGDDVEVDSGGNWSASVDLPLVAATTADGQRAIRVTDSGARTGVVLVTVPSRTVTITPEAGRVGTIAVIRGTGFPSKNDEGSSFNVEIVYDAGNDKETTVSAVPDASGRFEVQLRIPTTAAIPSTNTVRVEFEDDDNVAVVTTVAHEVPEGIINLSETSGGPGSTVTVTGEGFKSFVPISLVRVGALDVTPSPKPSTDGNGMMNFAITVPGLDVGIQTIEVSVGDTTASTGFTVTESGVNPGDIKPVAEAIEELGTNLVSVWNFNNDTKVWSFYDPTLAEGNTLTHMISGETYLIRIQSSAEVILNNDTRSLTCVGDNCWNQIVW